MLFQSRFSSNKWMVELRDYYKGKRLPMIMLVGTKSDLRDSSPDHVTDEEVCIAFILSTLYSSFRSPKRCTKLEQLTLLFARLKWIRVLMKSLKLLYIITLTVRASTKAAAQYSNPSCSAFLNCVISQVYSSILTPASPLFVSYHFTPIPFLKQSVQLWCICFFFLWFIFLSNTVWLLLQTHHRMQQINPK